MSRCMGVLLPLLLGVGVPVSLTAAAMIVLEATPASSAPSRPLEFATDLEAEFFDMLLVCEGQRDELRVMCAAERQKTTTATAACALTCPTIQACPADRPLLLDLLTHGAAIGVGFMIGSSGGDGVTVVR